MNKKQFLPLFIISFCLFCFSFQMKAQTGEEITDADYLELLKPQLGIKLSPINILVNPVGLKGRTQINSPTIGITLQKIFSNRWLLELNNLNFYNTSASKVFKAGLNVGYDVFLFKKAIRNKEKEIKKDVKLKPFIEPLLSMNYTNQSFQVPTSYDSAIIINTKDTIYTSRTLEQANISNFKISLSLLIGVQYSISKNWKMELSGGLKFADYNISTIGLKNAPSTTSSVLNGGFDFTDTQIRFGFLYLIGKKKG